MKSSTQKLVLAALLTAATEAQLTITTGSEDAPLTVFYSSCPTATSTTITLPTTVTYCPGPNCQGGGPVVTPGPVGPSAGGVHVGEYTSIGPDGKTTILGIYETVLDSLGPGGIVPATYTITVPCPCHSTLAPTAMPSGFVTTVVPCHVCEATGGPATVTLTQPCPTGPYATQTPSMGGAAAPASGNASSYIAPAGSNINPAAASNVNPAYGSSAGAAMPVGAASASSGMMSNSTTPSIIAPVPLATGAANKKSSTALTFIFGVAAGVALLF